MGRSPFFFMMIWFSCICIHCAPIVFADGFSLYVDPIHSLSIVLPDNRLNLRTEVVMACWVFSILCIGKDSMDGFHWLGRDGIWMEYIESHFASIAIRIWWNLNLPRKLLWFRKVYKSSSGPTVHHLTAIGSSNPMINHSFK